MTGEEGLRYAFRRLHAGESALLDHLQTVADRHGDDHEVHHVSRDLAEWSRRNVELAARVAQDHGFRLDPDPDRAHAWNALTETFALGAAQPLEHSVELLEDLRQVYLMASDNSLSWEMLAQHAQAKHETDILSLSDKCHPQTLRQIRCRSRHCRRRY